MSGDPVQLVITAARVKLAREAREALHDHLAVRIATRIGELFDDS